MAEKIALRGSTEMSSLKKELRKTEIEFCIVAVAATHQVKSFILTSF